MFRKKTSFRCDKFSGIQVELIEIINKPLLLHLVGYLYYWQMGFNSVFKGLTEMKF